MLNTIFEKLLSPIKNSRSSSKPPAPTKHLVIQTVYSSGNAKLSNQTSLEIAKDKKSLPLILNEALLDKQKKILLNYSQSHYSSIEQVTLNGSTVLIGLTKHSQPILRGIFMFSASIRYTDEWDVLKNKASHLNAGIAYFQPLHDVLCLKLTNQDHADTYSYLIDHSTLSRIKWLWHSSDNEVSSLPQLIV